MYPTVTMPEMLKVKEAMRFFKLGERTIRTAIQTGELPSYTPNGKTQLVKANDVAAWIESRPYRTRRRA